MTATTSTTRNPCTTDGPFCPCNGQGSHAVNVRVTNRGVRWFVAMNHAGFNTPANNAGGYVTEAAARGAVKFYQGRSARRAQEVAR